MPRSLPVGLAEVLKSGYAESHSTLELSLPSDIAPAITHYFATARLTIDGVIYDRQLRDTGAVKTSLTRAADRVTVELQNVDTILGVDLLAVADTLYGANVRFGRYWKDLRSAATFHHILLTGAVAGVEINETVVRLTLISDTYAAVSVGAKEQVIRTCRFQVQGEFRGTNCGYSGAKLTCNGLIDDTDGCEGRHGSPLKRAKFGGFVYIEGQNTIAGAAALPVPAYNQLMKLASSSGTVSATSKQQPFLALREDAFSLTNDNTNLQTRIAPKNPVQAINVKFDYGATGDGVTNDGTAVNNAVTAALAQGRPLYFPTGTYLGVNLTGITYQLRVFGDGMERSILKASAGNTPVIDIGNASSHTIEISDLTIEGAGNASGSSGHGIYVHDQSDGLYNFFVNKVWIKNCGGDGINVRGQFTNKFKAVFVSNCGGNGFDISGGNTILLDSCYVDDVLNNKVAYRIRAGQVVMLNCNGLDSLGSVSDWAVFGQAIADGDPADTYCDAQLIGCNVESFKRYGVWAKVGSRVDAKATFFTTSASGSTHVAIRTDFTNNQVGTFDSQCRFSTQGTGTWANSLPIHSNSDIPIMAIGRTDQTQYYADAAATARSLPSVGVTPIATVPYVYAPKLATDGLLFPTDNTGDIGASGANRPRDLFLGRNLKVSGTTELNSTATQSASVAGFLGWTITNSSSSGQAGIYGVNHSGKNVFLQVFQDGTGIAQMGSDHFPIYIKAAGTNRWYFDNLLFSPLQDDTSDLGAGSTRIKDAFLSGSLNLKERTAPSTPAANTLVLYAKDKAGASALYYKNDAGTETEIGGGGGGSGTVNTGAANALAYYPSSGTTVDDASGLSHSPGASPNFTVTAQNSAHVPLLLQLVASQSANALEIKNSGGSTVFNLTPSGGFTAAGDSIFSLTGSSTGSPRKLQLSNVGSGTAFRMELESEGTGFQAREAGKLQIQARYGVKIVGTRNSTFAPSFESGATTDPALYLENGVTGAIPLRVNAISSTSTNLAEFQSNASTVFSLTTTGVLGVVAASDPGSPTNSDLWRSSSRNAISIRNSGQTEDLSGSMWRSSASVFFDTTTTETSIISDTGVGTKTLAADRLKAGSHIRIKASGFYGTKATSPGTFTIKLKNGATTMLTIAAFTLPTNVADQNWWIEATGALNATGSSGTINWTITFHYNDGTGDLKTRTYTVNSTTINTTTTNALNITGQFSVSDAANFWQTDAACIEIF